MLELQPCCPIFFVLQVQLLPGLGLQANRRQVPQGARFPEAAKGACPPCPQAVACREYCRYRPGAWQRLRIGLVFGVEGVISPIKITYINLKARMPPCLKPSCPGKSGMPAHFCLCRLGGIAAGWLLHVCRTHCTTRPGTKQCFAYWDRRHMAAVHALHTHARVTASCRKQLSECLQWVTVWVQGRSRRPTPTPGQAALRPPSRS